MSERFRTRTVNVTLAIEDAELHEARFVLEALEGNHLILHVGGDDAWELSVVGAPKMAAGWSSATPEERDDCEPYDQYEHEGRRGPWRD